MKPFDPKELGALKAQLEPPWDALRERRVLAKVVEKRRSPRVHVASWAIVSAAVMAMALAVVVVRSRSASTYVAATPATPAAPAQQSTMALADGSRAVLLGEAAVQVEDQRADRVRIVQTYGVVRYEVRPDPSREFTVRARGTLVRVRGTAFTVTVNKDEVEVQVHRGHVEVDDGTRKRDLVTGESLSVPSLPASAEAGPPELEDVPPPADNGGGNEPSARGPDSVSNAAPPSAYALQSMADSARLAGNNAQAAQALESLVALHPRDRRIPDALFTLGRVERARDRQAAAAQAFEHCYSIAPDGPLAQDALAEAAASWSSSGADDTARTDANKYLKRWPSGPASARMQVIARP
jgi:transmembrane sensor